MKCKAFSTLWAHQLNSPVRNFELYAVLYRFLSLEHQNKTLRFHCQKWPQIIILDMLVNNVLISLNKQIVIILRSPVPCHFLDGLHFLGQEGIIEAESIDSGDFDVSEAHFFQELHKFLVCPVFSFVMCDLSHLGQIDLRWSNLAVIVNAIHNKHSST